MDFAFLPHVVYRVIFWVPQQMCGELYHPDDSFPPVKMWVEGFVHETEDALVVVIAETPDGAEKILDEEDQQVNLVVIPKQCVVSYAPKGNK